MLRFFLERLVPTFKRGFKAKERTAILYVGDSWSYGSGWFLILGVSNLLEPGWKESSITKEEVFNSLLFHELLHIWLEENLDVAGSALLEKYRYEHQYVLDHLHLMALQKMVYLNLRRFDILSEIDKGYRIFSLPEYRRAWEIVTQIEGYETVLEDLRLNLLA